MIDTSTRPSVRTCDQLFSGGQVDLIDDESTEPVKKSKKRKLNLKQNLKPVARVTRSKAKAKAADATHETGKSSH